jgi:hypothetical protein
MRAVTRLIEWRECVEMQDKYAGLLTKYRQLLVEYEKLYKQKQRKKQFSKRICIFGLALIVAVIAANFILLWLGREPMTDVTTIAITVFGGFATGGYFALCAVRDCSKNKHKINFEE